MSPSSGVHRGNILSFIFVKSTYLVFHILNFKKFLKFFKIFFILRDELLLIYKASCLFGFFVVEQILYRAIAILLDELLLAYKWNLVVDFILKEKFQLKSPRLRHFLWDIQSIWDSHALGQTFGTTSPKHFEKQHLNYLRILMLRNFIKNV